MLKKVCVRFFRLVFRTRNKYETAPVLLKSGKTNIHHHLTSQGNVQVYFDVVIFLLVGLVFALA